MARSKRSADKEAYWALMVEEQRRCGGSIRSFCEQKAISEPSFYAWRRELRKRDVDKAADNRDLQLISVDVLSPTDKKAPPSRDDLKIPLEIGTPRGFTLRFDRDTTPETISRLLDVLAQSPTGETGCSTAGATSC
jgi:hypothetical protein